MQSDLLPQSRLITTNVVAWPKRFRRVEPHRRDFLTNPTMADAVAELVSWLDIAEVGYCELGLAGEGDPAAVIRFEWRGRRLACGCDAFSAQSANVLALRTPINILSTLARVPRSPLLETLLSKMDDLSTRSLPPLRIPPESVMDAADLTMYNLGDSLAEACVRIARGERRGATKTNAAPCHISWSVSRGTVRAVAAAYSCRPQALALVQAALDLEPWLDSVKVQCRTDGCHLDLRIPWARLQGSVAKAWLSRHSIWKERRPDIDRWLQEAAR